MLLGNFLVPNLNFPVLLPDCYCLGLIDQTRQLFSFSLLLFFRYLKMLFPCVSCLIFRLKSLLFFEFLWTSHYCFSPRPLIIQIFFSYHLNRLTAFFNHIVWTGRSNLLRSYHCCVKWHGCSLLYCWCHSGLCCTEAASCHWLMYSLWLTDSFCLTAFFCPLFVQLMNSVQMYIVSLVLRK